MPVKSQSSRNNNKKDSQNLIQLNKNGYFKFQFKNIDIEESDCLSILENLKIMLQLVKEMEQRDKDLFDQLIIFDTNDVIPDPARSIFGVFTQGTMNASHPEMQLIYDGVMDMCQWIFSKFPTCDKNKCDISVLKTH